MKKIYLSLVTVSLCAASIGQSVIQEAVTFKHLDQTGPKTTPMLNLSEKGATLFSWDFSDPYVNWTRSNTSSPAQGFWFPNDPEVGPVAALNPAGMATAANGFAYINSDSSGNAATQNASLTLATAVDLSANPLVSLEFQQTYKTYQDTRTVRVSGDNGATWTDYTITDGTTPTGQNSDNPVMTSINISAVAGGQSQVLIEFNYQASWGWYWAIDDIKITETDADDLIVRSSKWGSLERPYFSIPITQVAPIDFSAEIENVGYLEQTNTVLTADINFGTFTGTSAAVTVPVGGTDSIFTTTPFTPSAIGTHTITMTVAATNADATPTNNVVTDAFEVVAATGQYGRDRGVYEGQGGGADGADASSTAFEAGSIFDIFADQQVFGIDVVIGTNTPAGTIIYGKLYVFDAGVGDYVYLDETPEYTTTQADADNNVTITLPLFTSPTLTAGQTALPMVGCYSEFYYGRSGVSEAQTSYILYGGLNGAGAQYYTTQTPMVRMNFDPNLIPTVNFAGSAVTVNESAGTVTAILNISDAPASATTVEVDLGEASTADYGLDFLYTSLTVTFPAGSTASQTVTFYILDDGIVETSENIVLNLQNPNGLSIGTNSSYIVTITDNDLNPTVSFNTSSVTVNENVGTVTLDVTLIDPNANPTTVEVALGASTATNGVDFNYTSPTTVTFPTGSSATQTVTLTIIDDAIVETSESVVLNLENPTNNATIGAVSQHAITITDNDVALDPVVTFDLASVTVNEDVGTVTVQVDIANPNANSTTVNVALGASTATNGSDFNYTTPTTVTFPAGSSASQTVMLTIIDDVVVELSENVVLNLENTTNNATIGAVSQHAIIITDNDVASNPVVTFDLATVTVNEDVGTVTVDIALLSENGNATSVDVVLGASTATNGDDFNYTTPTAVTFPAGSSTTQTVTLTIIDDIDIEGDENIVLSLQNPTNSATIGSNDTQTITVVDNDAADPVISFNTSATTVNESAGTISVQVDIANPNSNTISVDVSLGASTAINGSDFSFNPTMVTFPAGSMLHKPLL